MSDAYGGIILSTSEDCVVNSAELVSILNRYNWSNANGEWTADEIEGKLTFWYYDDFNCQYPTVLPEIPIAVVMLNNDGSMKRISFNEASDDEIRESDIETQQISLEELSNEFVNTIINGWIEIACTANEKNRYVYFESIRIYADGKAESRAVRSGTFIQPHYNFETFNPINI